jgi:hypothetical protein
MTPLILIPFVVFFGCCIAQFPLLRGIRAALAERHPEVWREISMKAWFANSTGSQMVWGGRAKALGDPALMDAVNRLRLVYAVGLAAWLALVALLLTSPVAARH